MRNESMRLQVENMVRTVDAFLKSLEYAAKSDDGVIDKEERRVLKRLEKATSRYKEALKREE